MNLKALIFDVDGTLFPKNDELNQALENFCIRKIAESRNLSEDEAKRIFHAKKKELHGATHALEDLGIGTILQISQMAEDAVAKVKRQVLQKDQKLVDMINTLKSTGFQLYVLRDGTVKGTIETLTMLGFKDAEGATPNKELSSYCDCREGIPFGPFNQIIPTAENGVMKPDQSLFETVLKIANVSPESCIMVGDRINTDLTPAKKLGMQTALVTWGEKTGKHPDVDFYLESVYDVEKMVK